MSTSALTSVPELHHVRNPISRRQVESVFSRSVAVFGLAFGAQTVPTLLKQLSQAQPLWINIIVPAVFTSLIVALVASTVRRFVRTAHALVSFTYLAALVSWPFGVIDPSLTENSNHWLYYLLTVAAATSTIAFSPWVAIAYWFITPIIYGFIRATPAGGGATALQATLDAIYAIILGSAIIMIITLLRQAAVSVDSAQATALDRYSHAVRQHATEVERVQVDSIVHDSVLTTLISAARAYTPEAKELAAAMASNAMGHLQAAALVSPDDGNMVRLSVVAERIADAAASMSAPFQVRATRVGSRSIPAQAGEAIASAAVQAMVNSLQHGGADPGISRWVAIRGIPPAGIEVSVGDTGAGFDFGSIPAERLGVRISILERLANAGGLAEIDSAPGEGTIVTIRWPHESPSAPRYEAEEPE